MKATNLNRRNAYSCKFYMFCFRSSRGARASGIDTMTRESVLDVQAKGGPGLLIWFEFLDCIMRQAQRMTTDQIHTAIIWICKAKPATPFNGGNTSADTCASLSSANATSPASSTISLTGLIIKIRRGRWFKRRVVDDETKLLWVRCATQQIGTDCDNETGVNAPFSIWSDQHCLNAVCCS